jgi:hypothetical protein
MSGKRLLIGGSEQARRTALVLRAYKLRECSRAHLRSRPQEPRGNHFWASSHPSRFPASCHALAEKQILRPFDILLNGKLYQECDKAY